MLVIMSSSQSLPELVLPLIPLIPPDIPIWVVGGAIRDHLLGKITYDIDFTVDGDAIRIARSIADRLGGKYFDLDKARGTGRVITQDSEQHTLTFDFARMRGEDIHTDLLGRDFTINAMAVSLLSPFERLDPLGGAKDLMGATLRVCSPSAIEDDPVRALRAVRFASMLDLKMSSETIDQVRDAGSRLAGVSSERIRDEVMRMVGIQRPSSAFRLLDHFQLLTVIFPELEPLRSLTLSKPLMRTALEEALAVVDRLGELLVVLGPVHDPELAANIILAQVTLRLGRFRTNLDRHLERQVASGHQARQLIYLAALYYCAGKTAAQRNATQGNLGHAAFERISADLLSDRAQSLRLSNTEIDQLGKMLRYQNELAQMLTNASPSPRAIYRFFRNTGKAGIEAILLSLASFLGTHMGPAPPKEWETEVQLARELFTAYFEAYEESVKPQPLLQGGDLIQSFGLKPGPLIGRLLELLEEAQVAGEIQTREEALVMARKAIDAGH
jgi:tRNA nucleotidyltransferase/poly(A) polymerase